MNIAFSTVNKAVKQSVMRSPLGVISRGLFFNKQQKEEISMAEWTFIEPETINPAVFGFAKVLAVKVKKHSGSCDVRCFSLKGWRTFADLTDRDPRTGKRLEMPEWFVFAAKGIWEEV